MPLPIRGVPMNNNYFPVGRSLPYPSIEIIKQAYKEYDEKLLSDNLETILNRDFNNRSRDDAWILASCWYRVIKTKWSKSCSF